MLHYFACDSIDIIGETKKDAELESSSGIKLVLAGGMYGSIFFYRSEKREFWNDLSDCLWVFLFRLGQHGETGGDGS